MSGALELAKKGSRVVFMPHSGGATVSIETVTRSRRTQTGKLRLYVGRQWFNADGKCAGGFGWNAAVIAPLALSVGGSA